MTCFIGGSDVCSVTYGGWKVMYLHHGKLGSGLSVCIMGAVSYVGVMGSLTSVH